MSDLFGELDGLIQSTLQEEKFELTEPKKVKRLSPSKVHVLVDSKKAPVRKVEREYQHRCNETSTIRMTVSSAIHLGSQKVQQDRLYAFEYPIAGIDSHALTQRALLKKGQDSTTLMVFFVWDGHGANGHEVTECCASKSLEFWNQFYELFQSEEWKNEQTILSWMFYTNKAMHREIQKQEKWDGDGTTCTMCVLEPQSGWSWMSWVGDSRAANFYWRKKKQTATPLLTTNWESNDHAPDSADELARLQRCKRAIPDCDSDQTWRSGDLNMTRSLGDKRNGHAVFSEPSFATVNLYPHHSAYCKPSAGFQSHRFICSQNEETILLLASDGLWGCYPKARTSDVTYGLNCLFENKTLNPETFVAQDILERICLLSEDETLEENEDIDNIGIIMLRFRLWKK